MKRRITTVLLTVIAAMLIAPAAYACGFLVSPNGSVQLGKTTTFVAWEDGIEHYITNFTFEGPAEPFGSLIPLPAIPTDVIRAGDWTLQRLKREVSPVELELARAALAEVPAADVKVLLRTRIDSLDIVVLEGGGPDVLAWVNENGFNLPEGPETDHMLDYYASRSPYFLAARFDPDAASEDDFVAGDGIPVQITMPTERPWVPEAGWFTYLRLETEAENVVYDLSVGVGDTPPSFVDAGLMRLEPSARQLEAVGLHWILAQPPTPEVVLTTEQIEALGFERPAPIVLSAIQIEALGFERGSDTGRLLLLAATVAVLGGFVGGLVIVAISRPGRPRAAAGYRPLRDEADARAPVGADETRTYEDVGA